MLIKNGFFMFKIEAPSRCKDLTVFDKPPNRAFLVWRYLCSRNVLSAKKSLKLFPVE